ncbi:hypothetical protein NBRC110019_08290 [Neptunitalea chrysea]|uniref:Uncharacterized protein n=2 Tax=Neptunitalea chrysea TaxID=1647581 RepID=A0A9W6B3M8_9FLAO|nr:hypothetical protein NBRC110019_08290 [Neptunitalea chrysea]
MSFRFLFGLSRIIPIDGIMVGYELQKLSATVSNVQIMGNYEGTDIYNYKFLFGYGINLSNRWQVSLLLGIGITTYKNYGPESFKDSSDTYSVLPEIKFKLNKHVGFYINSEFRMEKFDSFYYEYHGGPDFSKNTFWVPTIGIYIR